MQFTRSVVAVRVALSILSIFCIFLTATSTTWATPIVSRHWNIGTVISGGELTAPTMQHLVEPGGTLTCSVNSAADTDTYDGTLLHPGGSQADTITYSWLSYDQGTFTSPNTASTTWTAPATPGHYTLLCVIDDTAEVPPGDWGTRDDPPLMRYVTITVVPPPGVPTFSNVTTTSLTATMPAVPDYATSLSLQQKLTGDPDSSYVTIETGLDDNDEVPVTGLTSSVSYTYRAVAVYAFGGVNGSGASVTTNTALPGAPGALSFSNLTPTTVDVTAPALPSDAYKLTLQRKVQGESDSTYVDAHYNILGYQTVTAYGMESGGSYTFRYVAVGVAGSTPGTPANVTLPTMSVAWSVGSAISCGGIFFPANGATIVAGSEVRVSAYLATDWDGRDVTIDSVTTQGTFSDPCSYTWSANGGVAKNGINKGQSFVWIAPATPGTYTIVLTVDDQNNGNKPSPETGTRNDIGTTGFPDVEGFNDDATEFTIEVNVVAP